MERSAETGDNEKSPLLSSASDQESAHTSRSLSPSSETRQTSSPDARRNGGHVLRQPLSYHSISSGYSVQSDNEDGSLQTSAVISRYKYYNRLAPHQESSLHCYMMPEVILAGNKCDLPNEFKAITLLQGEELAGLYQIPYFEISAKHDLNIRQAFEELVHRVLSVRGLTQSTRNIIDIHQTAESKKSSSTCC